MERNSSRARAPQSSTHGARASGVDRVDFHHGVSRPLGLGEEEPDSLHQPQLGLSGDTTAFRGDGARSKRRAEFRSPDAALVTFRAHFLLYEGEPRLLYQGEFWKIPKVLKASLRGLTSQPELFHVSVRPGKKGRGRTWRAERAGTPDEQR